MKILDIVFDTDGVLGDWVQCALDLYNSEYGLDLTKKDVFAGNLKKIEVPGTDLMKYIFDKRVYSDMKPFAKAQELIKKLSCDGHRIYICTAVAYIMVEIRGEWLKFNFDEIDKNKYMFMSDKSLVGGNMFIDDAVHNLVSCKADNKILLSRPWNQQVSEKYQALTGDIVRVDEDTAFDDIYSIACQLAVGQEINKNNYLKVFKDE